MASQHGSSHKSPGLVTEDLQLPQPEAAFAQALSEQYSTKGTVSRIKVVAPPAVPCTGEPCRRLPQMSSSAPVQSEHAPSSCARNPKWLGFEWSHAVLQRFVNRTHILEGWDILESFQQ
eukprot:287032-Amphidinium_carterae.1